MNRRDFTRTLMAAIAAPAMPLPAMAKPATVAVPNAARFWAIYMTRLHGDVTPGMLTQMTGLDPSQTSAIRAKLVADNVISPTGFIRKGIASQTFTGPQKSTKDAITQLKDKIGTMGDELRENLDEHATSDTANAAAALPETADHDDTPAEGDTPSS